MKKLIQNRWLWFLLGVALIPTVSFVGGLFAPMSPKDAMPFSFVREESTRTFRGDADYTYTLRSRATKEEFSQFIKKMKMEPDRVSDERYERKTENGRLTTTITYTDGWIIYEEFFT